MRPFCIPLAHGTSIKINLQLAQLCNVRDDENIDDLFTQKFDFREGNLKKYGSKTPPKYDETLIDCEYHIIGGGKDLTFCRESYEIFAKKINSTKVNPNVFLYEIPHYYHSDLANPKSFTPLYEIIKSILE